MKTSNKRKTFFEELQGTTDEIIRQIRKLIKKGNARRLMIVNKKGKVLFQTQLTAGLAGSALLSFMAPIISALGMFALAMNDVKVIVEKYPADQLDEDEYEIEAEVIVEVEDEESKPSAAPASKAESAEDEPTHKTVGKEDGEPEADEKTKPGS